MLILAALLNDPVAVANRPGATTNAIASFQNRDSVTRASELVGRNQPGDSCAEHDNRPAVAAGRWQPEILGACRRRNSEPKRLHRQIGRGAPADSSDLLQQCPARQCHIESPPLVSATEWQQFAPCASKICLTNRIVGALRAFLR